MKGLAEAILKQKYGKGVKITQEVSSSSDAKKLRKSAAIKHREARRLRKDGSVPQKRINELLKAAAAKDRKAQSIENDLKKEK